MGKLTQGIGNFVKKDTRFSMKEKIEKPEDEEALIKEKKEKVHSKRLVHVSKLGINYDKYLPFNNLSLNDNYLLVKQSKLSEGRVKE